MARKPREPYGLKKSRPKGKSRLEELGEGVHKTGLWILGMLYVFILMAIVITLLSVTGIVDPSERPAQQLRELELIPGEPDSCHASYDKCLDPDALDYDCKGGAIMDGPLFVDGPVIVSGPDVFDLDGDGNGVGCEEPR